VEADRRPRDGRDMGAGRPMRVKTSIERSAALTAARMRPDALPESAAGAAALAAAPEMVAVQIASAINKHREIGF